MKRLGIIVLLISSLFMFSSVISVNGVQFTATEYWFFIDEPTLIDYPDMNFSIGNELDTNVTVSCSQESIEGLNITTQLAWNETVLAPNEKIQNHYAFEITDTFAADYLIRINCEQSYIDNNGKQRVATGGIITSWISYYSNETGSLLDLKIKDQSGSPRNATVQVYYKKNETIAWSPIKTFDGNRLLSYLPNGLYQVIATDHYSSVVGQKTFVLENDTEIEIELFLLGFGRFEYLEFQSTSERGVSTIGINSTINNFFEPVEEASIYLKLFKDGELFKTSQTIEIQEIPLGIDYKLIMWFEPIKWEVGNYSLVGYIDKGDITLSTKYLKLGSYNPNTLFEEKKKEVWGVVFWFIAVPITAFTINKEILPKLKYTCQNIDCDTKNFKFIKYCNKCGFERIVDR